VEYDVEQDHAALALMRELTGGQRMVPVLIEDGKVVQLGWQGRGCVICQGKVESSASQQSRKFRF